MGTPTAQHIAWGWPPGQAPLCEVEVGGWGWEAWEGSHMVLSVGMSWPYGVCLGSAGAGSLLLSLFSGWKPGALPKSGPGSWLHGDPSSSESLLGHPWLLPHGLSAHVSLCLAGRHPRDFSPSSGWQAQPRAVLQSWFHCIPALPLHPLQLLGKQHRRLLVSALPPAP